MPTLRKTSVSLPALATVILLLVSSLQSFAAEGFKLNYTVKDEPTLAEISIRLYGTTKRWRKIAEWNHLESPYRISMGQKLVILSPPTVSEEEGNRAVREMWRKVFEKRDPLYQKDKPDISIDTTVTGDKDDAVSRAKAAAQAKRVAELKRIEEQERLARLEEERRIAEENARKEAERQRLLEEFKQKLAQEQKEAGDEPSKNELTAEQAFIDGKKALAEKDFARAEERFKQSREANPDQLESWFGGMKALKSQGKDDEAKRLALDLIKRKPELKNLPVFSTYGVER